MAADGACAPCRYHAIPKGRFQTGLKALQLGAIISEEAAQRRGILRCQPGNCVLHAFQHRGGGVLHQRQTRAGVWIKADERDLLASHSPRPHKSRRGCVDRKKVGPQIEAKSGGFEDGGASTHAWLRSRSCTCKPACASRIAVASPLARPSNEDTLSHTFSLVDSRHG